ncbi:carbohydrate kinase [Salmonella enterica subsp. enterica serovar Lexington]|nr:carbohydrate kinase [Salmonella enterica subsp. enterica serovar Lexington]
MKNLIPPINTPDNLYHDGNPVTGELGTLVTAEWLNNYQDATRDLQSELLSILAAAGINPESSALQLLTAIRALTLSRSNPFGDIKNGGTAEITKALSNLGLGDSGGYVGRLIGIQRFTSSGSYIPTPGCRKIRVTMTGGGGGGGGCQASSNRETFFGAGGGAGATVVSLFTLTGAANYRVTIGAGGTGGTAAVSGSDGGTTGFSTILSAPGGQGGGKSGTLDTYGGAGGVATTGDIRLTGGYGGDGQSGFIAVNGAGGASYFGGGGRAGVGSGTNGAAPGSGGGGAYDSTYSGSAMRGGSGAPGIMIIEELA